MQYLMPKAQGPSPAQIRAQTDARNAKIEAIRDRVTRLTEQRLRAYGARRAGLGAGVGPFRPAA